MCIRDRRTIDTVAPESTVNDVGLPSANPLTINFPLVLCSVETVSCSGAVSYTHLDVYKRQVCINILYLLKYNITTHYYNNLEVCIKIYLHELHINLAELIQCLNFHTVL